MKKKLKQKYEEIITKKEAVDKLGMTIPKNTKLFIIDKLVNPRSKKKEVVAYVDNGTDDPGLMPKTLVEVDAVI